MQQPQPQPPVTQRFWHQNEVQGKRVKFGAGSAKNDFDALTGGGVMLCTIRFGGASLASTCPHTSHAQRTPYAHASSTRALFEPVH